MLQRFIVQSRNRLVTMMKAMFCILVSWMVAMPLVFADLMVLEGVDTSTITTGDLLDGIDHIGTSVPVVEIPGLFLTARSGGGTQIINATATSLGINTDGGGDDTDAFDAGESMVISFNKDIRVNLLDFNLFEEGDSFAIVVGGTNALSIAYNDLSNKLSDWYATSLVIAAGTEIEFTTSSPTPVGLDGIDLDVIPEPAVLGLIGLAGVSGLVVRRFVQ